MAGVERGRVVAYILVKVLAGKERDVVDKILKDFYRNVTEARITYGDYDIVVRVEADNMRLLDSIVSNIRKIDGVEETKTLIAV
ncbi:MAG: Lrp/AsnC ligand binding domain-containing protein [Desulfurococcales archaeon]|nr:Lrp/AsnC ligand binding domain-containing protein [Desulfurococcales archaeon]